MAKMFSNCHFPRHADNIAPQAFNTVLEVQCLRLLLFSVAVMDEKKSVFPLE
jgi:hypothetical protein